MDSANLTTDEQALLIHARQMGGYLVDNLTSDDRRTLTNLAAGGLFELVGEGAQRRYALTAAGDALAAQIANR